MSLRKTRSKPPSGGTIQLLTCFTIFGPLTSFGHARLLLYGSPCFDLQPALRVLPRNHPKFPSSRLPPIRWPPYHNGAHCALTSVSPFGS